MKPMAWLSICVGVVLCAGFARAQGFRAGAGAGRGGTVASSPRAAGGTSAQRASGFVAAPVAPARSATRTAPQWSTGFGPALAQRSATQQQQNFASHAVTPPLHRGGGGFLPPPRFVRPPHFFLGVTPFHPHRHWFFKRHPGIVFIDAFPLAGPVVITEVAPGVIRADRGLVEESPAESRTRGPGQLAPFDPMPQEVVERMLVVAGVKKGDVIYDLGSGDGRILITAAKKYGVRGVGYEIDGGLIKLARENARKQGVEHLVEFRHEDFLVADLSPASVVTLYLSQDGNLAVRGQLMRQLRPGARVVSYTFDMGEWQPKVTETYRDAAGDTHVLYLWQIGEPMLFSDNRSGILQPQPTRDGPLIIDVR